MWMMMKMAQPWKTQDVLVFDDDNSDDDNGVEDVGMDGETFALSDKADPGCRSASPSARCSRQSWIEIETI